MSTIRSVCPYCGVGCGVLIETRRGRIEGVQGDPKHPTNRGRLCAKGSRLAEVVRTGDRLLHPLARACRSEPFRRVSWREAVDRVASGIRRSIAHHGPESVALYLSGQLLTEDYYAANKLGKGLIKTPNVDTNSRLCMSSTVAAYKRAFGADGPPGCYEDLELARDVLIVGSNLAETHPILFSRLHAARGRLGAHWTVVDPRRTVTAGAADEHLAIRPGTDVALLLGMAQVLFEEGLVDEAAVGRSCTGLREYRLAVAAMPPERAAAICGVPAGGIRAAARRFARSPAALSLWCQGLNQSSSGTDKISALIDLHLLTGQLGRPGAGPLSLTGQANAMGGREVGGMATELACHRAWDDAEGRAEVERHWELGPLPVHRGLTAVELVDAMLERRVRVLWVACTNPLASLPDGWAARAALEQLDLLVVQELYHPTDTTGLAHVLLPAAGWAEKTGTLTSSERRVALAGQALPPPGEARPDWAIFAAAGAALGAPAAFAWRDSAEVFREHVRLTGGRDLDMTGLAHDVLEREGPSQWPYPAGGEPRARRYGDGRCHTPDGRPRLVAVAFREPAELPSPGFPLRLVTGRERDRWHTLTRSGRVAALRDDGTPVLRLHPTDARAAGVEDHTVSLVSSRRGSLRAVVAFDPDLPPGTAFLPFHPGPLHHPDGWPNAVDPDLPPGTAFLPFHPGPLHHPDGWPNALPARALDPVSLQPELKHTAVRVEPARPGVALAGGSLAAAVAAVLDAGGVPVRCVALSDLARQPPGMLRAVIAEAQMDGTLPWWEASGLGPAAPGAAVELHLAAGPEPLAALPELAALGWRARWRGEPWLPAPVCRLLARRVAPRLPSPRAANAPVLGAAPGRPCREAPPGTLVLEPGGRLGLEEPLSGDPAVLAALLAGTARPRAALRRLVVPLSPRRTLVVAGRPFGGEEHDTEHSIDLLVHEDRLAGCAQVWRLAAGRVLGAAALVPPAAAREVEALWLADAEPELVQRRFPVR